MRNALSMIWLVFYSLIEKTYKSTLHADPIRIEKRSLKAIISKMAVNDNFKHHRIMFLNRGILLKMTVPILFTIIFISPSTTPVQNASALASAVQITSAKADGSDFIQGAFVPIAQGKTSAKLTFEYRGFDDNDHVVELRCSWDGVNYLKSNCSSESAESQSSFQGPDGVTRTYYVKTGMASRDISPSLVPKTYTFGVRVLNDNGNLGPATTWTFKMKAPTNTQTGGAQEGTAGAEPEKNMKKVTVRFDWIRINDDHDYDQHIPASSHIPARTITDAGDWNLNAFVQGKPVLLLDDKDVYSGKTYRLDKEITVNIRADLPLSMFTMGLDDDTHFAPGAGFCPLSNDPLVNKEYYAKISAIFTFPKELWIQKITELQSYDESRCDSSIVDALGRINMLLQPPRYLALINPITSSNGDFLLRYSISVEPVN